jgi:DNA-binding NarL/FixJ family response regulator
MRASRTVVLAIDPDVMPDVQKRLAEGGMGLSNPIGGKESMRVHQLGAARLVPPEMQQGTPEEIAERMGLTRRTLQLLQLISCGLPTKEIGARLGIGEMTVKTHAARLYRKLGVKGGAPEAVAVGYRTGLLTGGES